MMAAYDKVIAKKQIFCISNVVIHFAFVLKQDTTGPKKKSLFI